MFLLCPSKNTCYPSYDHVGKKTMFQSVYIANSSNVPENQLSLSLSPSRANQQGSYTAAAYATQQGHRTSGDNFYSLWRKQVYVPSPDFPEADLDL